MRTRKKRTEGVTEINRTTEINRMTKNTIEKQKIQPTETRKDKQTVMVFCSMWWAIVINL